MNPRQKNNHEQLTEYFKALAQIEKSLLYIVSNPHFEICCTDPELKIYRVDCHTLPFQVVKTIGELNAHFEKTQAFSVYPIGSPVPTNPLGGYNEKEFLVTLMLILKIWDNRLLARFVPYQDQAGHSARNVAAFLEGIQASWIK